MIELETTVSDSVIEQLKLKIGANDKIRELLPTDEHFKAMFKVLRDMTDTDKSWNDMSDDLASLSENDRKVLRYYGALRTAKSRSKSDKKPAKTDFEIIMVKVKKNGLSDAQYNAIIAQCKANQIQNELETASA